MKPVPISFATAARVVFFVFFVWFWGVRYGDFLYMAQEYDLFLWRADFAAEAATRLAGLSRYVSAFFVQFFYYPLLGGAILASFLVYIEWATARVFKIRGYLAPLAFLPSALLSTQITQVNYFVFEWFDVAYLFSFIFNYAFFLTVLVVRNAIVSPKTRTTFLLLAVLLGYPIFGFFALAAGIFALVQDAVRETAPKNSTKPSNSKKSFLPTNPREKRLLAFLFVLAIPALYWPLYAETTPTFRRAYVVGLLEETVLLKEFTTIVIYWAFAVAIMSFYVVASLVDFLRERRRVAKTTETPLKSQNAQTRRAFRRTQKTQNLSTAQTPRTERVSENAPKKRPFFLRLEVVSTVALAAIAVGTVRFSFFPQNFAVMLKVARALDREDWDTILREEAKVPYPINPLISARILAQARTGRLGDEVFTRPLNPKRSPQLETVGTTGMGGDRILYHYGSVNLARRAATNAFATKRERSVWATTTLALCAVADERRAVAERCLYRLQGTLFHRARAVELATYLRETSAENSEYSNYLTTLTGDAAKTCVDNWTPRIAVVRAQKPFDDQLTSGRIVDYVRYFHVQKDDLSRRPLQERETLLATLLLMRDLPTFAKYFDGYLAEKQGAPIPRYLQEAALFRAQFPQSFGDETSWRIPKTANINPEIEKRFVRFLQTIQVGRPNEQIFYDIETQFGDTFWAHGFSATQIDNY